MCGTCGCSDDKSILLVNSDDLQQKSDSTETSAELHASHHHGSNEEHQEIVKLETEILSRNNHLAQHNREEFEADRILALNLVSSPGSGKTTLLEKTLTQLSSSHPCAVIEGDQQTANDAQRIAATGVNVIQVNTGTGCHLEADSIRQAKRDLNLKKQSYLFIENVGNLVCPALFDLGEACKVLILSVTEGEDKPLKYPHMFKASNLMILNKTDLLPYIEFDVEKCIAYAKQVNPDIQVIQLSATSGEGMNNWFNWLADSMQSLSTKELSPSHVHSA